MKKIIGSLVVIFVLAQTFCFSVFAEDVNAFPPQRPEVGNMKLDADTFNGVIVGLRTNGTINVKAAELDGFGTGISTELKNELLSLTNIVDVACTRNTVVALKSDGTVYVGQHNGYNHFNRMRYLEEASAWTDIVAIETGMDHLVGLKSDGTVVAVGVNTQGQCDVTGWNNISKIYATESTTIAIRKDGSVLATGEIKNYSELRKYKDVKNIIKSENGAFEVMFNDGTVSFTLQGDYNKETRKYDELSFNSILEELGINEKIVQIEQYYSCYYVLTENGNLYYIDRDYPDWTAEKIEENIVYLTFDGLTQSTYYAIDANGQIWSNEAAFTSDDWILTTNITYNGNKINSDVPPYVKDGRTLAPIRAILEALGMTVSWDGTTQTATAVKADITISVTINSNIAVVNGVQKTLDVPAEITNGRTFVPVRFFAEALNMNVDWDGYTKTVIIEAK